MGKNFFTTVETSEGPRTVHVNRRGCKGHWTEEDQRALAAITDAALRFASAPVAKESEHE